MPHKRAINLANTLWTLAKPNLAVFVKYAKVELVPPSPREIGGVARGFTNILGAAKSGRWKQITVKEAWLNTLVAAEVTFWFYVGEVIGRRHFIGYEIKV